MNAVIRIFKICRMAILSVRFIPHVVIYIKRRKNLQEELDRWLMVLSIKKRGLHGLLHLLIFVREYRSVFYLRIGGQCSAILRFIAAGQESLHINTTSSKIGAGLVIQHGHSTRIGASSIGKHCQVWHNVTIGKKSSGSSALPSIGHNVRVCTGSVVIGGIHVGDNVTIGAGAIVTKDVPPDSVVIGNPAFILKRNGIIVNEKL